MKILFLSRHIDRPNAWMLSRLHSAGNEICVICHPLSLNIDDLKRQGVSVSSALFRHRLDFASIGIVRKKLQEGGFEIMHSIDARALAAGIWAARRFKLPIISYRGAMGGVYRTDPGAYLAHLNPRVDRIICVSNAVKAVLSRSVPEGKLLTIYKGHDPSWYEAAPRSALMNLGIPKDALVVSCVANARPHKGVQVLFSALHLVRDRRVHVLFIGNGGENRLLRKAARGPAQERICFAGYRQDAAALVGATDMFVMPSLREGLARAVLEAMAQGVPPIVSAAGGLPEVVEHGRCGTVVPPNDPAALADAIDRYAADEWLRSSHGEAAQDRIKNEFNIARTYEQTLELYSAILSEDQEVF